MFRAGTRTPSKSVSQKGEAPLMRRMGRVLMPGVLMSMRRKLMPWCLGASGSVRTRQNIQSDRCACDVQIFRPSTT